MIRAYTPTDYEAAKECIIALQDAEHALLPDVKHTGAEIAEEYLEQILRPIKDGTGQIFVAEIGRHIAGLIAVVVEDHDLTTIGEKYLYISDVVVHDAFRGRGLGKALMEHAEAYGEELGIEDFNIGVMCINEPALALYLKMHYEARYVSLWKKKKQP